jgi:Glycosyl transferase family 2
MKTAVFTTTYNESIFLPMWVKYYGDEFGRNNLFILDDGSTDGSTDMLHDTTVIRLRRSKRKDEDDRAKFISRCQKALLKFYDIVIYTDTDEFLIPDPEKYRTLADFISLCCKTFVNPVGLDLYHVEELEPAIDLGKAILSQRSYVKFSGLYCKPLISRIALEWEPGLHACQYPPNVQLDLFLFHLKRMDVTMARNRLHAQPITWSPNAERKMHGFDYRFSEQDFISYTFDVTTEAANAATVESFHFEDDIKTANIDQPNVNNSHMGGVAVIPDKFKHFIDGGLETTSRPISQQKGLTVARNRPAERALRFVAFIEAGRNIIRQFKDR